MTVRLPDLGPEFTVLPLNDERATQADGVRRGEPSVRPSEQDSVRRGEPSARTAERDSVRRGEPSARPFSENTFSLNAKDYGFVIQPGVYLLSKDPRVDIARLPERIGSVGLREFVCPQPPDFPVQVLPDAHAEYRSDQPIVIGADVIDPQPPVSVDLLVRTAGTPEFRSFATTRKHGYRYEATIPAGAFTNEVIEYAFMVHTNGGAALIPAQGENLPGFRLVPPDSPLVLFDAAVDTRNLFYTRIGDTIRRGIFQSRPATTNDPAALRLFLPLSYDRALDDYTASLTIKDRIGDRRSLVNSAKNLRILARGSAAGRAGLPDAGRSRWHLVGASVELGI